MLILAKESLVKSEPKLNSLVPCQKSPTELKGVIKTDVQVPLMRLSKPRGEKYSLVIAPTTESMESKLTSRERRKEVNNADKNIKNEIVKTDLDFTIGMPKNLFVFSWK